MASLIIVASLGLAGAAYIAKRSINHRPGGIRLYVQRKNISLSHRLGLLDDVQAAAAYDALRKHYDKLVVPKPINLSGDERADSPIMYDGPFRNEMTKKEARLILGLNEEQSKNMRYVTRQWRQLMLRNHPDIGGSPYLAAKINEAKEIAAGEKVAKEDAEEEEDQEKKRGTKTSFNVSEEGYVSTQMAAGGGSFRRYNPMGPGGNWNEVEDIFHRKVNRKRPLWMPEDVEAFAPEENWKLRYLKELNSVYQQDEYLNNQTNMILMESRRTNTKDTVGMVLDDEGRPEDPIEWRYHREDVITGEEDEVDEIEVELEKEEKDI